MKIIFITREGYDFPAARIRCYNFAEILEKSGYTTEVLSYADHLCAGKTEKQLGFKNKIMLNFKALERLHKEKDSVFFLQRLNYHSFGPYLARCINNNKLIFDLDDWEIREDPKYIMGVWPTSKAEYLTKIFAKSANICIAASNFLFNHLKQYNLKAYYLPTGVDTDKFCPNGYKRQSNEIIFAWVGTMHRQDNVENIRFIIDCFNAVKAKYNNIKLEITGDGIYKDEVKRILHNTQSDRIKINEWLAPKDMPAYLEKIDIGLLPLTQDTKFNKAKSPVKLFEYMSMAKPAIASFIGEASLVINDGRNGLLAGNKEEFISKMEFLVNNPEKRIKIGQNARNAVMNFSLSTIGRELINIIKKI